MRTKLSVCLLFAALIAPAAQAQTADEIIAKHIESRGGLEKIKGLGSARLSGKMQGGPMELPITMEWKRPNKMRMEFTVQGMTGTMTFDGTTGWMHMPFMGKATPEKVPAEQLKDLEDQADMDGPLVDYKEKGHTVEYAGTEKLEGTDVHKLKLTKKNGDVSTLYLDSETFLQIKEEGKRTMRGQEMEYEVAYGDYKDVDGLILAHSIQSKAKGAPAAQTITIETIEPNVEFAETRFTLESEAAAAATPGAAAPSDAAPTGAPLAVPTVGPGTNNPGSKR